MNHTLKSLMALALLEIASLPNVVVTINKEGIRIERITKEEDPTDNYMVLSHDFSIQEQQYDYSVNDINFPVIWYNNLTTYLSAYYEPDVDLENNKKY